MEWVRCNSCGYYPSSLTRLSIFLTSCGHLSCSKCLERAPATEKPGMVGCLQCRQPCKTVKLGPDSQPGPDVTFYFSDEVSAVKKLLQAAQFQKMHYELGAEMAKRKRLLWEIKEGERQEKELVELGGMLEKLTIPLAHVLEGVREKAKRAGIQLPLSQEFNNRSRPNSPSCSPAPAAQQHQQQLHPPPNSGAQLQTPTTRPNRQQGYSFSPGIIQPLTNRSPATIQQQHHQHQQQHSSINASPLSTTPLMMSKYATASAAIPGSADPRVTANLMTQSQLQNWSQSHAQQQLRQQSPGGTGAAMGSVTTMTPTQTAGSRYNIMHSQYNNNVASRPGVGLGAGVHHGQHNMHPLNSVRSMHTPSAIGGSAAIGSHGGVGDRAQAVAVGRSTRTMSCGMPLTMVPGSVLSQAASR